MDKETKMAPLKTENDIEIALSSVPALKLWKGRAKTENKFSIVGVPGFIRLTRLMELNIKNDDPYADYFYHQIDLAVQDLELSYKRQLNAIVEFMEKSVPKGVKIPDVVNEKPTVIPVRSGTKIGFRLVYQLLVIDQIAINIALSAHIGLLTRDEKIETLKPLEREFRAVLNMAFRYKATGVTRDDLVSSNQKAITAIHKMGSLEEGYLTGEIRSQYAPVLPKRRLKTLTPPSAILQSQEEMAVPDPT